MKNLFEAATAEEIQLRIARLRTDSERAWGKMTPARAVAHCAASMEWALGDKMPPRMFVGRILGAGVKPMVFNDDAPMRRNSPTAKVLIVQDDRNLDTERERLRGLVDRFFQA
jgi:hypothetical protein